MAEATPKSTTMKTSDVYRTSTLPERFNDPTLQQGYTKKAPHPVYATSSSSYGGAPPSIHTMPTQYHGRTNTFTAKNGAAGNYTYNGLNTSLDKSIV